MRYDDALIEAENDNWDILATTEQMLPDEFDLKNMANCTTDDVLTPTLVNYEFYMKDEYRIENKKNFLTSVGYNQKQKMFLLVDCVGVVTWRWRMLTNKIQRVSSELNTFLQVTYCSVHNCYFALKNDGSIILLNRNFEEVHRIKSNSSGTILCMIYNEINDELLTSSIDGVKIWCLINDQTQFGWKCIKEMSNYRITLKNEFKLKNEYEWIKKIEIDSLNCHLYCCSDRNLYVYDFNGNLVRYLNEIHTMSISCCVYSSTAKYLITGSVDTHIKVWSLKSILVDTLKFHTAPVTSLALNPFNSNLVFSSSLDGTIKMFSLDTMQTIYELSFNSREIHWMGVTDDNNLYISSKDHVMIWSISNFIDFWSYSNHEIKKILIEPNSRRVITMTKENSFHIFTQTRKQLAYILPIPLLDTNDTKLISWAYSKTTNTFYQLLANNELWVYYTKTNPSTKVAIWNALEIQESAPLNQDTDNFKLIKSDSNFAKTQNVGILILQNVIKKYRAVDIHLSGYFKGEPLASKCLAVLESHVMFWNLEGKCCTTNDKFLLLGLKDGIVLFCDTLIKNKKYLTLNCGKDPVIEIKQDKRENWLITKLEMSDLYHIQYWSLPDLDFEYELFCSKKITCYLKIGDSILLGANDGSLEMVKLNRVESNEVTNKIPNDMKRYEIKQAPSTKFEHRTSVESIDFCHKQKLFLSFSKDGCIKVWKLPMQLVCEINLDSTLAACNFLNDSGDLVVGWKNHLFYINLQKIVKIKLDIPENQIEDTESLVFEESLDRNEFFDTKVDLDNYLHPFDIKLTEEGEITYKKTSKANGKKRRHNRILEEDGNEQETPSTTTHSHYLKRPSDSVYCSPRPEDPLINMNKIDLTLTKGATQFDIHQYLIDLFTEYSSCLFPKKWRYFPRFGLSPTSTPSCTPPESPRPFLVDEKPAEVKKSVDQKQNEPDTVSIKPSRVTIAPVDQKEIEQKVKERVAVYERSNLRDIRINSKNLLVSGSVGLSTTNGSTDKNKHAEQSTRLTNVSPERKIVKRKIVGQRKTLKNRTDTSLSRSDRHKERDGEMSTDNSTKTTNSSLRLVDLNSRIITTRRDNKHAKSDSGSDSIPSRISSTFHSGSSTKRYVPKRYNGTDEPRRGVDRTDRVDRASTDKLDQTEQFDLNSLQTSKTVDELQNMNDIEPSQQTFHTQIEPVDNALSQKSVSSTIVEVRKPPPTPSLSETRLFGMVHAPRRQPSISREEQIMKTKLLFDYLHGIRGAPKRISTANYEIAYMPDEHQTDADLVNSNLKPPMNERPDSVKGEVNVAEASKNIITWLKNYELKRDKLSQNQSRARANRIESAKHPGTKKNLSNERRPKSVTFSLKRESKQHIGHKKSTTGDQIKPIIHVQTEYLVSQIEMEDILNQVVERIESAKSKSRNSKNYSSVSFADTVCEIDSADADTDNDDDHSSKVANMTEAAKKQIDSRRSACSSSFLSTDYASSKRTNSKFSGGSNNPYVRSVSSFSSSKNKNDYVDEDIYTEFRLSRRSDGKKSNSSWYREAYGYSSDSETDEVKKKFSSTMLTNRKLLMSRCSSASTNTRRTFKERTPSSIPSKWSHSSLDDELNDIDDVYQNHKPFPKLDINYRLPHCPEKYLLPVRFPIMYRNIIHTLLKIKADQHHTSIRFKSSRFKKNLLSIFVN